MWGAAAAKIAAVLPRGVNSQHGRFLSGPFIADFNHGAPRPDGGTLAHSEALNHELVAQSETIATGSGRGGG
jgi:hypothetical protein